MLRREEPTRETPMTQRLKKSETLEIRLPYPTKLAFMARCQDQGRSASEALRGFIEGQIGEGQIETRPATRTATRLAPRFAIGALIAAAVGAVALPSLAHPNQRAAFDCLARSGAITAADLARLDANHDGRVSYAEFQAACAK